MSLIKNKDNVVSDANIASTRRSPRGSKKNGQDEKPKPKKKAANDGAMQAFTHFLLGKAEMDE